MSLQVKLEKLLDLNCMLVANIIMIPINSATGKTMATVAP